MTHAVDLAGLTLQQPSVVTIGVFDGVHRGHQTLLRRLISEARAAGRLAVVITFFPHPDEVLHGRTGRYYLMTPEDRAATITALGVDHVITLRFDDSLRQIRAAAFVDALVTRLKLASLWVGVDFALGYRREGDVQFLRAEGARRGFGVHAIELIEGDGVISSTLIRDLLTRGEVERAADLLGRCYHLSGEVIPGDQRGRTIGFRTANLALWDEQIIPANGVYAGWAWLGDERFMAVTNIGIRPTFDGQAVRVEAHLLDFDRDIYGQTLRFEFVARLRAEKRFDGIDALIAQIAEDTQAGRDLLTRIDPHQK